MSQFPSLNKLRNYRFIQLSSYTSYPPTSPKTLWTPDLQSLKQLHESWMKNRDSRNHSCEINLNRVAINCIMRFRVVFVIRFHVRKLNFPSALASQMSLMDFLWFSQVKTAQVHRRRNIGRTWFRSHAKQSFSGIDWSRNKKLKWIEATLRFWVHDWRFKGTKAEVDNVDIVISIKALSLTRF